MKKIKMTNEEIAVAVNVMDQLKETGALAFAIAKNTRKLKDEAKEYIALKGAALEKYGKRLNLKDNKVLTYVPEDKKAECEAEYADVKDVECEIDITTVSEELFCSGGLTSGQMEALLWMVEDKK